MDANVSAPAALLAKELPATVVKYQHDALPTKLGKCARRRREWLQGISTSTIATAVVNTDGTVSVVKYQKNVVFITKDHRASCA